GKKFRISRRRDIRRVFRAGRRVRDGQVTLLALANADSAPARRFAVVVSRRHGPAVRRNRIKRLYREAFRLVRDRLPEGFDYVVVPRIGAMPNLGELREAIVALAGQAVAAGL
ncbi:unnamed protein product, partial [marine sediment metagenome]